MMARGHRIVRYADDILIVCRSESAAKNALVVASNYLEGGLKRTVNQQKTHITHSNYGVAYLGVEIFTRCTRIQDKKVKALKAKVKYITRRNTGKNLMGLVRCRLRCIQLKQWKKSAKLHRRLKQLGYKPPFKVIKMKSWHNARSPLASYAMPNAWFHNDLKLVNIEAIPVGISVADNKFSNNCLHEPYPRPVRTVL